MDGVPWWGFVAVLVAPAAVLAAPVYVLVRFLDWRDGAGRYADAPPPSDERPE